MSMPPVGLEPTNPSDDQPQTYPLYRAATVTGNADITFINYEIVSENVIAYFDYRDGRESRKPF
jgi:hypothetical protein